MAPCHLLLLLLSMILLTTKIPIYSSFSTHILTPGSSISVENKDHLLVSPNGLFTAGFHPVGENAYAFAVWFSEKPTSGSRTVVWMANRDTPVNGKRSKLSLWEDGNLVLIDAGQYVVWSTQTESTSSSVELQLHSSGNLVLHGDEGGQEGKPLWQSFDHPTDTLLPNQLFTKNTQLVSSRSANNYSSGFYKLFFDNDSILRLLYDGPETTSAYWPDPRITTWRAGRFQFIESRIAKLDSNGEFISSDGCRFKSSDFGTGVLQRMLKIDIDGNLRLYSLVEHERRKKWEVQWQALSHSCWINGACGPNSLCTYSHVSVRKCNCLHGFKMVNSQDWSYGCEPEFQPCTKDDCGFLELPNSEFYGHDYAFFTNTTLDACKNRCLQNSTCRGFQLGWILDKGYFCFLKASLHNGYQMGITGLMYIKLPKTLLSSFNQKTTSKSSFSCSPPVLTPLLRSYHKTHDVKTLGVMLAFGCAIGFIEIICIVFFWYCSSKHSSSTADQIYFPPAMEFRRFTYRELKRASRNFSEEIGRGGASVVYKGKLTDNRIAAIKRLKSNHQGEAEFQAEISTIGRVNHMNLLETWGYCAEGKHRLVVYEFMENGSLAENLGVDKLEWATRFDIAIGTAKGLAYIHDECLEWVLHCDVKPQNILLDANYNPKVADFGLSKLLDRGSIDHWNFSMMRGTRGYMAPEWVLNQPITSKVDVFSYGVVMLEMITGRSPTINQDGENEMMPTAIEWVRDRIQEVNGSQTESWVKEIVAPSVRGEYDETMMENLVRIAVRCTDEDREARPSMREVVNVLLHV
ncbi:putative receptor protein kinase ZmPK1 [Lactuca sativa]|nr:putative receptor protein kinase ZmPK1 [Lactuca sativa]